MREQDNVAVVDRCYEAFGKGDIEAFRALMADDIEWDTPEVEGHSFGGHRVGGQQLREFFRLLNESEEVLLFEPQEFIAQGEKVAVVGRHRIRVRSTGRIGETPWIHVWTVRDGVVVRFFELFDTAKFGQAYQQASST